MKKKFYFFSLLLFLLPTLHWGDDIWFMLPTNGQPVTGTIKIKIYPPENNPIINVWIESDHTEDIVWMGQLVSERDYTISVDTARFVPGKYEINAIYYLHNEEYEGDIDIWVNAP